MKQATQKEAKTLVRDALAKAREGKIISREEKKALIQEGKARQFNNGVLWVQVSPMKVQIYQYDPAFSAFTALYSFRGKIFKKGEEQERLLQMKGGAR